MMTSSKRLGSMMSMQASLPRLPVPPLQQTMDKFLWSVRPLLSKEEYIQAQKMAEEFQKEEGQGQKLQKLLEERAKNGDNWLSDWWLDVAYLGYRSPLPIHVNPSIQFSRQNFHDVDGQIKYGAKLIAAVVDFKKYIDNESFPLEKLRGQPVCMSQYHKLLCVCRVPGPTKDSLVFPASSPDPSKHVVIMRNNHIFSLEVYCKNGQPLSTNDIYRQLKQIVRLSEEPGAPIGILTAGHRDDWGAAYQQLIKDPANKESLEQIQRSIFILCLDKSYNLDKCSDPSSVTANMMNHGGGINQNGGNRWYDKPVVYILSEDGANGGNGEHSPMDGPPMAALNHHIIHYMKTCEDPIVTEDSLAPDVKELEFHITDDVHSVMMKTSDNLSKDIADLHLVTGDFTLFGKNFVKSHKLSPDSFFQVTLQLAYYRMYRSSCPTYESGSLRRFIYGRTDTIRSCSPEAQDYAISMVSEDSSDHQRVQLLKRAVQAHRNYTDDVINGKGIDRHLLGLRLIAAEHGLEIPEFLTHPFYTNSTHWKLSTSQVPMGYGMIFSFGPVVPDGYGVFYNIQDDIIQYSVSCWRSCPQTDTHGLSQNIKTALTDSYNLLSKTHLSNI